MPSSLLARIDAALARGASLDDIDSTLIEPESGLTSMQKAAAWLYAFSCQQAAHRRAVVVEQLQTAGLA